MRPEILDQAAYETLVRGGEPVKRMREGVKVWRLPDDRIVKLFRPRGRFSRSRLYPANQRFTANAQALTELGIETVVVEQLFEQPQMGCSGVVYQALPGETLEVRLSVADSRQLLTLLASTMVNLHVAGIVFRSLHLGNLLVQPDGGLALIDVEDMTISRRPLGVWARLRNFRHLLRRDLDRQLLGRDGYLQLVNDYLAGAGLRPAAQLRLRRGLLTLADSCDWPEQAERS